MSIKGMVRAKCPFGCGEFEAEIWTLVRGDTDSALRETLKTGELNLLICPVCGRTFHHEDALIYFDPASEILAFGFPRSYEAESEKWRRKMAEDHAALGKSLLTEKSLSAEPEMFFGLEGIKALLESEDITAEETEVISCIAQTLGLKTAKVRPSWARARGVSRLIPFTSAVLSRKAAEEGLRKVMAKNDSIPGLARLLEEMEKMPGEEMPPLA
ncbi:MAG: CpXC domain-containing protein [bacterium]